MLLLFLIRFLSGALGLPVRRFLLLPGPASASPGLLRRTQKQFCQLCRIPAIKSLRRGCGRETSLTSVNHNLTKEKPKEAAWRIMPEHRKELSRIRKNLPTEQENF
jgi:hypothetical protein